MPERIAPNSPLSSMNKRVTSRVQTPLRKADVFMFWIMHEELRAELITTVKRQSTCVHLTMSKRTDFANLAKRDHC